MLQFRSKKVVLMLLLLMCTVAYAGASGKKVWSVNVAKLGYKGDVKRTIVRWRGSYVAIGSSKFVRHEENRQCILAFDPEQPLLVFDVAARKQVSKEALNSYEQEWEPPRAHKNFYPCSGKTQYLPTGMILTSDLSYGHDYDRNEFIVLDDIGKEKYRIWPDEYGCWGTCIVSSRSGKRFAILERGQSLAARISNVIVNLAHDPDTDKKCIRVYSTSDGRKLFALSWIEPNTSSRFIDESERVAFSDDGEMLAVLDDEGSLRVFRISDQ
jgi:hypothetical protein